MINSVNIVGRLTKDAETKSLSDGTTLTKIRIAYTVNSGGRSGFINVTFYGDLGDFVARTTKKGHKIAVSGNLDYSEWDNTQGERQYSTEITGYRVALLSGANGPSPDSDPDQMLDADAQEEVDTF